MSQTLTTITGGGGGEFIPSKIYPIELFSAGATGTYKTLTPPAGKRIKISILRAGATQTNLTTIAVGGVDVVSAVALESTVAAMNSNNEFIILEGINEIIGGIDEVVELKTDVATSQNTFLIYQEGGF